MRSLYRRVRDKTCRWLWLNDFSERDAYDEGFKHGVYAASIVVALIACVLMVFA